MATRRRIDYHNLIDRYRIHTSLYTDPEVLADEFDKIFHRGWVYVGHVGEIPNRGDFRLKKIGRYPLIMVRDETGAVRLLLNRCRHRGSTVCQIETGNSKTFRCAYHGWTYRNNGELAGVPYQEGYGDTLRKEDFGLLEVPRMEQYRGFVFGSLSHAGITLDDHLGLPAKEQIDLFVDLSPEGEIQVQAGVHKFGYPANWKFQLENAMDGYHPNFTHQTFLDMIQQKTGVRPDVFNGNSSGESRDLGNGHVMLDYRQYNREYAERIRAVLPTTPADQDYRSRMIARYGAERTAEVLNAGGTHTLIFPNLILIGAQIRVPQPVAVDRTEVTLYPTTLKGVSAELNSTRLRGHEAFFGPAGMGQPDDVEMFARMQEGIHAELEPWILISRGMHRERRDKDGTLVGHATDEVTLRGIWAHYLKVMSASTAVADAAGARSRANGKAAVS
jgi:phenylpropionate dioxygenase-like ring-hydroxylating dioxygenase large terminal subunit